MSSKIKCRTCGKIVTTKFERPIDIIHSSNGSHSVYSFEDKMRGRVNEMTLDISEILKGKSLVYMQEFNSCCYQENDNGLAEKKCLSHEQLLDTKPIATILWFVDSDKIKNCWGDDWDDAPSCCNSGSPYTHRDDYPKITKIEMRYGAEPKVIQ